MATDKQREANRRNAQNSTGPRTQQGRDRSKYNALKHGLCADDYFLDEDAPGAIPIQEVLDHWNNFYQPQSPVEAMIIRRVVSLDRRLDRIARLETGTLAQAIDGEFNKHTEMDESGALSNPMSYDYQTQPRTAGRRANRVMGMGWRAMCREGDAIPKLDRYETGISNRLLKFTDRLLDIQEKRQTQELRNEPNFEDNEAESMVCEEAPPPEPAPAPPPDPEPAPSKPPAREHHPAPTVESQPKSGPNASVPPAEEPPGKAI